jgi:hypothetical protein
MEGVKRQGTAEGAGGPSDLAALLAKEESAPRRMTPALVQSRCVPPSVLRKGDEAEIAKAAFSATRLW